MGLSISGIAFKTSKKKFPFIEISKITGEDYVQIESFNEIGFPGYSNYFAVEYHENSVWIYGDCFTEIVFGKQKKSQEELFELIGNPSKVIGFQESDFSNFCGFNFFQNGVKIRQRTASPSERKFEFEGKPLPIETEIENSPKRRVELDIGYYVQEYSYNFEGKELKLSEEYLTHSICYFLLKNEFGFCPWHEEKIIKPLKKEIYVLKSEYTQPKERPKESKPKFDFQIPFLNKIEKTWNNFWSIVFPQKIAFLKAKKVEAQRLKSVFSICEIISGGIAFLTLAFVFSWLGWLAGKPSFYYFFFQVLLLLGIFVLGSIIFLLEFIFSLDNFDNEKLKTYKSFLRLEEVQKIIDSTSISNELFPKTIKNHIQFAIDYRYALSKIGIYDFDKLNDFFAYIDSFILKKFNFKIDFDLKELEEVKTKRRIRFNGSETTLHSNLNAVILKINNQLKREEIDFAFYEFETYFGYDYIGLNKKDFKILNGLKKYFNKESGLFPFKLRSK